MKLYSYYRSSAAYRIRIALNLKGIDHQIESVNLLTGEEQSDDYATLNPQKMVPMLEHKGQYFYQSMAILEYLDEVFSNNSLLPQDVNSRVRIRALANMVACDIHPLNNLRVLKYLKGTFNADSGQINDWYRLWVEQGFDAIEKHVTEFSSGQYCEGVTVSLADVVLIPQIYNARRFDVDMSNYPAISSIEQHCLTLDPFIKAMPENQLDAL